MDTNRKTYILDTNVIISSPEAIFAFDEHDVVIPDMVIEELDNLKKRDGDAKYNAVTALRIIDSLRAKGNIMEGVEVNDKGGQLRIAVDTTDVHLPTSFMEQKGDNRILKIALGIYNSNKEAVLVSQDTCVRIKADILGIPVEDYRNGAATDDSVVYTGRHEIYCVDENIDYFFQNDGINCEDIHLETPIEFLPNEYVHLLSDTNPSHSGLGRVVGDKIIPLKYDKHNPFGVHPRNMVQHFLQEALMLPAEDAPLVIIKGPAGTAKTFYSLAVGLDAVYEKHQYRKVLITRANVKFDADIGYLKGSEEEKIAPLIRFAYDNLENLLSNKDDDENTIADKIQELFDRGVIAAEAMAYMRGRSINNTYIFIDEAQNLTPSQVKGLITRAGIGTKIILAGDPDQIDNPKLSWTNNGLTYAIDKMKDNPLCHIISFTENECVRSALAVSASNSMHDRK